MAGREDYYRQRIQDLEQRIIQKDRKIAALEDEVHAWYRAVASMPAPFRKWALWRYSKRN